MTQQKLVHIQEKLSQLIKFGKNDQNSSSEKGMYQLNPRKNKQELEESEIRHQMRLSPKCKNLDNLKLKSASLNGSIS